MMHNGLRREPALAVEPAARESSSEVGLDVYWGEFGERHRAKRREQVPPHVTFALLPSLRGHSVFALGKPLFQPLTGCHFARISHLAAIDMA